MPSIQVRPVDERDLVALDAHLSVWPGLHRHRFESQCMGQTLYLSAWLKDRPLGCVLLAMSNDELPEPLESCADLAELTVHPNSAASGVEGELIYRAEEIAFGSACEAIGISVGIHDRDRWRLLHRLGYRPNRFLPFVKKGSWIDDEGQKHQWAESVRYFIKDLHRKRIIEAAQHVVDRTPGYPSNV